MFSRGNHGRELTERQIMEARIFSGATGVSAPVDLSYRSIDPLSPTDTALTANRLPAGLIGYLGWVLIDPFGINAELRKAESFSGNVLSWTTGLSYSHSLNAPILFLSEAAANVKFWGAVGNGSIGDLTALNRAMAQLGVIGGGLYYVPGNNQFLVSGSIDLVDNIRFRGDGFTSEIYNPSYNGPAIHADALAKVDIEGIHVNGGSATGGSDHGGIRVDNCSDVRVVRNSVRNFEHVGINIRGSGSGTGNRRIIVTDNHVRSNAGNGIWAFRANQYLSIEGNVCHGNGASGISLDDSSISTAAEANSYAAIVGNICYDNTDRGITLEGAQGVAVVGNTVTGNGVNSYFGATQNGDGIALQNIQNEIPCRRNLIANNVIGENRNRGILLNGARFNKISGNLLYNNNLGGGTAQAVIYLVSNTSYATTVGAGKNVIADNTLINSDTANNALQGIYVSDSDCDENVIKGNVFKDDIGEWTNGEIRDLGTDTIITQDNIGANIPPGQFADGDTTPSIKSHRHTYETVNTGATSITTLDDGKQGQVVTIHVNDAVTTFKDISTTGNFELAGSADFTAPRRTMITFVYVKIGANTYWREISRSQN